MNHDPEKFYYSMRDDGLVVTTEKIVDGQPELVYFLYRRVPQDEQNQAETVPSERQAEQKDKNLNESAPQGGQPQSPGAKDLRR